MSEPELDLSTFLTVGDIERAARTRLSTSTLDYFRSGADAQTTRRANRRAFRKWDIAYRVLVDVSHVDMRVRLLGREMASPILIAPTAYHCLAHPDGELATARAAAKSGAVYVATTLATKSLEHIASEHDSNRTEATSDRWFQLYVNKDRGITRSLVERAEAAGYRALVVTVDTPVMGRRLRDVRNAFTLPAGITAANLSEPAQAASDAKNAYHHAYSTGRHDPSFTWRDVTALRDATRLPILLKGVVRGDDALRAMDAGAAGIVISNHGGRQLDGSVATLDALPGVLEAVASRGGSSSEGFDVLIDGGIRWGTDALKALALGARAVLVGRPIIWGLTLGGEAGVARVLEILRAELATAMALSGCPDVASITRDLLAPTART